MPFYKDRQGQPRLGLGLAVRLSPSTRERLPQDDRYEVVVNGRRHLIFDAGTLQDGNSWAVAAKRLLEIVNELLGDAGSEERLYGIYGGNEGRVVLLTGGMYRLLHSPGLKLDPRWVPYPPTAIRDDGTVGW
jgi:hypothetical protein